MEERGLIACEEDRIHDIEGIAGSGDSGKVKGQRTNGY
jgi:hypothetical protein